MPRMSKESAAQRLEYERNTHFQGFAKLLYPDLEYWFRELFNANLERNTRRAEQAENMIKLTLTRRAFDLLTHAKQYGLVYPEDVPDLTVWRYCYSCLVEPQQPGSNLCSTCHQEREDELQDHYDSHYQ